MEIIDFIKGNNDILEKLKNKYNTLYEEIINIIKLKEKEEFERKMKEKEEIERKMKEKKKLKGK